MLDINELDPPEGWFAFGTHLDERVELSKELGHDLLPLWERPIAPNPSVPCVVRPPMIRPLGGRETP